MLVSRIPLAEERKPSKYSVISGKKQRFLRNQRLKNEFSAFSAVSAVKVSTIKKPRGSHGAYLLQTNSKPTATKMSD